MTWRGLQAGLSAPCPTPRSSITWRPFRAIPEPLYPIDITALILGGKNFLLDTQYCLVGSCRAEPVSDRAAGKNETREEEIFGLSP